MARPLRIEFPGAIHHVTSRMIGSWVGSRERLFRDDRDYHRFLKRLGEGVDTFGIRLYLCTLMSNHFHLVLETPRPTCPVSCKAFRRLTPSTSISAIDAMGISAKTLGMGTGAGISAQIKRMPEQLKASRARATLLREVERRLEILRQEAAGKGD